MGFWVHSFPMGFWAPMGFSPWLLGSIEVFSVGFGSIGVFPMGFGTLWDFFPWGFGALWGFLNSFWVLRVFPIGFGCYGSFLNAVWVSRIFPNRIRVYSSSSMSFESMDLPGCFVPHRSFPNGVLGPQDFFRWVLGPVRFSPRLLGLQFSQRGFGSTGVFSAGFWSPVRFSPRLLAPQAFSQWVLAAQQLSGGLLGPYGSFLHGFRPPAASCSARGAAQRNAASGPPAPARSAAPPLRCLFARCSELRSSAVSRPPKRIFWDDYYNSFGFFNFSCCYWGDPDLRPALTRS